MRTDHTQIHVCIHAYNAFVLTATGIDPFTPLTPDKLGSAGPVKGSSPRPGSPTGNNISP